MADENTGYEFLFCKLWEFLVILSLKPVCEARIHIHANFEVERYVCKRVMPRENLEKTVKIEFSPNYFTKTTYFEPNGD